ncbi:MAG: ABC-type uncharacterized transport system permease subunit [Halieaceae bacterium]
MTQSAGSMLTTEADRRRRARDRAATVAINAAGISVIGLLLLMLAYLVATVMPLAQGVLIESGVPQAVDFDGGFTVSELDAGLWLLPPNDEVPTSGDASSRYCPSSGQWAVCARGARLDWYDLSDEQRIEANAIAQARFSVAIEVTPPSPKSLHVHSVGSRTLAADFAAEGVLRAWVYPGPANSTPFSELAVVSSYRLTGAPLDGGTMLLDAERARIILVQENRYIFWQLPVGGREEGRVDGVLTGLSATTTVAAWGPGRETLLIADSRDQLHRFDPQSTGLVRLGEPLILGFSATRLISESLRRVSYLASADGRLLVLAPASGQRLYEESLNGLEGAGDLAVARDGAVLYTVEGSSIKRWSMSNPYPDTGWRSLWTAQRYGGYEDAAHVWQPDGAAISVLPKLGLTPLLYGTFKAALYGMLLAIPLALGAAVYTGYFLSPRLRNRVKPAIEMLEAFPTVVLGFIAGLWLAPILADYLVVVFLLPVLLIGLPLILAAGHLALQSLSPRFVGRPPRAALVAVAYLLGIAGLFAVAGDLEVWLFDGSTRDWLWRELHIRYEQRNALLVGLAMGVAITPTLFSIVEDAIFAVPRGLSDGSLALGATRWQSLARVVLPAASPALLSALLIGLARGLGETMIVLLATGNTPVMEADPFSGLRALSASIAAELPEAGAGSTHFRLLFLAALVLFAFTFIFNTVAELFRLRLRYSYAGR